MNKFQEETGRKLAAEKLNKKECNFRHPITLLLK